MNLLRKIIPGLLLISACIFIEKNIGVSPKTRLLAPLSTQKESTIKTIGFVIKHKEPEAENLAVKLADFCLSKGYSVTFADESKDVAKIVKKNIEVNRASCIHVVDKVVLPEKSDLIVVLGGDGTLLSIARLMQKRSVPAMGINIGKLGFLAKFKPEETQDALAAILSGKMPHVSERSLLEVSITRNKKVVFKGPAVNDAVISKGAISRIIGLAVSIDGFSAYDVHGDGIIISTPTGSTAYSLSAGGPIIEPSMPALVITAICPHSLSQRPLVVSDNVKIQIRLSKRTGHVYLTLDGQEAIDMEEEDVVTIKRFKDRSLKLISCSKNDYFNVLREKLKFG